jgi:protease-4
LGGGNKEYYLATVFDEIYMQPHTYIGLTGLSFEIPFVKEFLDKIGVYPEFFTRYEYKTSMMSFTDTTISKPYSENLNNLGNSILSVLKTSITENRKLNKDVHDIINNAPIKASDGVNYNMIDGIMYLSEFEKKLKDEGNKHFVYIEDYASGLYPNNEKSYPTIAFLSINGLISNGNSFSDFNGEYTTGSKTIIADIEKIKNINNLKAVIVRINSPGGDYNASDEIYQSLTQLKKDKNIPIIVSQSGYAASGGYFISLAGDKIVAEPSTITGSIGVLGGKFVLEDLWKKIGINWADIKFGNNSDMLSLNKKFTKSEQKIFEESLDDVYKDFTSKVIENRPLKENIENIAKGRIWTGIQAKEIGLVDEIGGYGVAISLAKQKANIPNDAYFNIVIYPQEKTFSEKIRELILNPTINTNEFISKSGVDIRYLKLFKRLQYDTVLPMFEINM